MLQHLLDGFTAATGSWSALGYLVAGVLLGMYMGVIPGLSGTVVLSIALVFVYKLDLQATLVFFLGVHAAGNYSASISSILLNAPPHAEAIPVGFDGYPMAQRGQAARALGLSAMSTAVGAVIGGAILIAMFQVMSQFTTIFHPPEYVAVVILAMLLVATLGVRRVPKALASVAIGLLLSMIGTSTITGEARLSFNSPYLFGGLALPVIAIGVFAIPQMVMVFGTATAVAKQDFTGEELGDSQAVGLTSGAWGQVLRGTIESFRYWLILIRSSIIGWVVGAIPGMGAFTANYMSYGVSKQMSRKRGHLYGTGIPEGIVAAEASSIAKEEGSKVTSLGLGLPSGTSSALFIVAMAIQGVPLGIGFVDAHPVVAYEVVWVLVISGVLGTVLGVISTPMLARVTNVSGPLLFAFVIPLCLIGTYISDVSYIAMVEVGLFGLFGFVLRRLGYSLASFLMGLVLGPILEQNVYLAHRIYPGLSFLRNPLADILFACALMVLGFKVIQGVRTSRNEKRTSLLAEALDAKPRKNKSRPYPLLDLITSSILGAVGAYVTVHSLVSYRFATALMPAICGALLGAATLWMVPGDIAAYRRYRTQRRATGEDDLEKPIAVPVGATVSGGREGASPEERSSVQAARDQTRPAAHGRPAVLGLRSAASTFLSAPRQAPGEIPEKAWGWTGQYTRELVAFAWVALSIGLAYLVGFHVAVPLFCVLYSTFAVRRVFVNWWRQLAFTICSAVVLYLLVAILFGVLNVYESPIID